MPKFSREYWWNKAETMKVKMVPPGSVRDAIEKLGESKKVVAFGEKPIRWDYFDQHQRKYLHDMISVLMNLKVNEDIFETENYSLSLSDAMKRIELNHESMDMRIIGNFGVTSSSINPNFSHTGEWFDLFNGTTLDVYK